MGKKMKRIALVCWCIALIVTLCSCSFLEAGKIRKTLTTFQTACEELDIDAMLDCIDPDTAKPIRNAVDAYTLLTGADAKELLPTVLQMVFGEEADGSDLMNHISIKKPRLHVSGDTAEVECQLHFTTEDSSYSRDIVIQMKKINDKWYIAGLGQSNAETE